MISVIKIDKIFMQLIRNSKELKIGNIILHYKSDELFGSYIIRVIEDEKKEYFFSMVVALDIDDIDEFKLTYVLFKPECKAVICLSEKEWQLLQPNISYGLVDIELSIKNRTIFYLSE